MKRARRFPTLLLAVLAASCGGAPTGLVVVSDTDLPMPDALDTIRVRVTAPDGRRVEERLEGEAALPGVTRLDHEGGPLGPVRVVVTGSLDGTDVVSRSAEVELVTGEVLVLRMELLAECVGVRCEEGESCAAGGCRPVIVGRDELETWTGDVDRLDAGSDDAGGPRCEPAPERCNGADDDCDTEVDEAFDLDSDLSNCGACGAACELATGTTSVQACEAGSCTVRPCELGLRNCDGRDENGCESDLRENANCGECGVPCSLFGASTACGTGECVISACEDGYDNCDGRRENGCEIQVDSDVLHCGRCDARCPSDPDRAAPSCVDGVCDVACDPGFADCDGSAANGCETDVSRVETCGGCGTSCMEGELCSGTPRGGYRCQPPPCVDPPTRCGDSCVDLQTNPLHCSACGMACGAPRNASPVCADGRCDFACDAETGDCDGVAANGCEASLRSLDSCGACGVRCEPANGFGACVDGTCVVASCAAGFADCDGDPSNGCEARLGSDPANCGGCGNACGGATPACDMGRCAACAVGFADCDGLASNGCETSLRTTNDCGGCGVACALAHATASCASGACEVSRCDPGWGDCNAATPDGCERSLETTDDCGACGAPCARENASASCDSGACAIAACAPGFDDCDGVDGNGCERSIETLTDCGSCGAPCDLPDATESCGAGTCQLVSCAPDRGNCDGDSSNGCEVDTRSNPLHCGGCGAPCDALEVCLSGSCVPSSAAVGLGAGGTHTCARLGSGAVWCWGSNGAGQLGDGTLVDRGTPAPVPGVTDATSLALGGSTGGIGHTCALRSPGTIACWGRGASGELGDSFLFDRSSPVSVIGITSAVRVAARRNTTCATLAGGGAYCWGRGGGGQLGDGLGADSAVPVAVLGGSDAVRTGVGRGHACVVRGSGSVACWGSNASGELGPGTAMLESWTPVEVPGFSDAVEVRGGRGFTCARRSTGVVECWGSNGSGQLGDGTITSRSTPAPVPLPAAAVQLSLGNDHACARLADGTVACWGAAADGQLGGGITDAAVPTPTLTLDTGDARDVAAGGAHTCVLRAGPSVECTGSNSHGQLGDGTLTSRSTLGSVVGL